MIELTPRRNLKKTVRVKRLPRSGEHARRTGTGDGLPRMATEAVADVVHGWRVFYYYDSGLQVSVSLH